MARITNFGKSWYQSMVLRLSTHPESVVLSDHRMQLLTVNGTPIPALWMILVNKTYWDNGGINVDHGTLAEMEAQAAGCIYGLATHGTTPWYDANAIYLGVTNFLPPSVDDPTDTSTISFFAIQRTITFLAAGTYPMNNVRGI